MKTYAIVEIFRSLQGEGLRAGTAAVFIRFAGCNLRCTKEKDGFDCDTDHRERRSLSQEELIAEAKRAAGPVRWVVLTGGEPGLQIDDALVERLHGEGFKIAVETNGTVELPKGLDWIAVSAKPGKYPFKVDDPQEVKVVLEAGQPVPNMCLGCPVLLSPAFDGQTIDRKAMEWCVKLVEENPQWRLSIQQHKVLKIR